MEEDLTDLFNEIRLTFNALARLVDDLHADEGMTAGTRAVLEFLKRNGPHTVPQIANARGVTRQRIQTLANELLDAGLVTTEENPAHKRSVHVVLTDRGRDKMKKMLEKESEVIANRDWPFNQSTIKETSRVLQQIREHL